MENPNFVRPPKIMMEKDLVKTSMKGSPLFHPFPFEKFLKNIPPEYWCNTLVLKINQLEEERDAAAVKTHAWSTVNVASTSSGTLTEISTLTSKSLRSVLRRSSSSWQQT